MPTKTTDNINELFDIVDENDQVIGQATRADVHRNPKLIHRSVAVAVFNKKRELFLQKRSVTKDTDPLKWTISCSGHVNSGDDYLESALRELKEELGISGVRLTFVSKYLCRAPNETEMSVLYQTTWNNQVKLQHEEIIEGRFFTRKALTDEVKSGQISLSFMGKIALEKLGWIKI